MVDSLEQQGLVIKQQMMTTLFPYPKNPEKSYSLPPAFYSLFDNDFFDLINEAGS